jgi:protein ImuA
LLWVSAQSTAQRLWACEQALRCAEVDAVLLWCVAH